VAFAPRGKAGRLRKPVGELASREVEVLQLVAEGSALANRAAAKPKSAAQSVTSANTSMPPIFREADTSEIRLMRLISYSCSSAGVSVG
jgi:hypothetical protein